MHHNLWCERYTVISNTIPSSIDIIVIIHDIIAGKDVVEKIIQLKEQFVYLLRLGDFSLNCGLAMQCPQNWQTSKGKIYHKTHALT